MMRIKFEKGGRFTMTPTGYSGPSCTNVTKHYTKYMAGVKKSDVPTEEMYEDGQGQTNAPQQHAEEA